MTSEAPSASEVYRSSGAIVVDELVPPPLVSFLVDYLNLRGASGAMAQDSQVPGSLILYGDPSFDTLLAQLAEPLSALLDIRLVPTYSFARVYRRGNVLPMHTDRPACEHSVSLHLAASGGDEWGIEILDLAGAEQSITLSPGAGIVYQGGRVRHGRGPCPTDWYAQVFLHYVDADGSYAAEAFDRREALGTPSVQGQCDPADPAQPLCAPLR
jgi:hypothetical protein